MQAVWLPEQCSSACSACNLSTCPGRWTAAQSSVHCASSLQGVLLTAVEALKLFFLDAAARGQLPAAKHRKVKCCKRQTLIGEEEPLPVNIPMLMRQPGDPQEQTGAAGDASDAAAQHAAWLARQRASFEQRLLELLAGQNAVLQVTIPSTSHHASCGTHTGGTLPLPSRTLFASEA